MTQKTAEQTQLRGHNKQSDIRQYINGTFVESESGAYFDNPSPFTNKVINRVSQGSKADIDQAVAAATKAFKGSWGKMKVSDRMKYIERIADLIDEEAEELSYLESLDTGLPIAQTRNMAARAAENFRFYSRMVQTRMHGEAYMQDSEFINYTVYNPLGAVGLITPWNAPFMLTTWKVAPALATGNTVILKPAELSPLTANKLAEIIHKANRISAPWIGSHL